MHAVYLEKEAYINAHIEVPQSATAKKAEWRMSNKVLRQSVSLYLHFLKLSIEIQSHQNG